MIIMMIIVTNAAGNDNFQTGWIPSENKRVDSNGIEPIRADLQNRAQGQAIPLAGELKTASRWPPRATPASGCPPERAAPRHGAVTEEISTRTHTSGKFPGNVAQISRKCPGIFPEFSRKFPGIVQDFVDFSRNLPGNFPEIS